MVEMIILIGLQASGKSTFYRSRFAEMHEHISKDLLRNNKQKKQRQLIEEALQADRSVVIDNTNPTKEDRAELIQLARQYQASVTGYYFAAKPNESLERNKARQGKDRVPPVAIFATLKRLALPSYEEGFDRLYYVSIKGEGEFTITAWKDD